MTERKPPGVSFESWVDKQIREAEERGAFKDLPGAGKPLQDRGEPYDENWWVKEKLRREGVSVLPPTLRLRKEAEDALAEALRAPSERVVRRIVAEINEKIREAIRRPLDGPPLNLVPFEAERVVREWREAREGRDVSGG
ncbi:J-domain-containing protein [Streptomyces sp. 6N223]|uniref:J-domain-containing protein n=1 Tax=Streptomyces sp. 6N223 TaxID=3457412 RepID=UPI003FCF745D